MLYVLIVLAIIALIIFALIFPFTTLTVHYKDMQLDGRNITAKFLDEIVEMYEGVTQEEIAELLREQYGVEE